MFIVKRTSPSGGTQYLVEGVTTRYRWAKMAKSSARLFSTKSSASRLAKQFEGTVASI